MAVRTCLRRLGGAAGLLLLALLGSTVHTAPAQEGQPKPLTPEQQKHLKEWDDLVPRLAALLRKGKRAEAVALVEQKVDLDRKLFGGTHEEVDRSLRFLGLLSVLIEDFPTARKARGAIVALRAQRHGAADWRVRDARLDLDYVNLLAGLDAASRR